MSDELLNKDNSEGFAKVDIDWESFMKNVSEELGLPSEEEIRRSRKELNKKWSDKRKRRNLKLQKRKQRNN